MCVAVRQPPVVRGAQPQPGRRRHRSGHLEGDAEGEGVKHFVGMLDVLASRRRH